MARTTIIDILETQQLGPLRRGARREAIEKQLGPPASTLVNDRNYVTYWNLEIQYEHEEVTRYKLRFDRPGDFDVDAWVEVPVESQREIAQYLEREEIEWLDDQFFGRDMEGDGWVLANGITILFLDGEITQLNVSDDYYYNFLKKKYEKREL